MDCDQTEEQENIIKVSESINPADYYHTYMSQHYLCF